MSQMRSLRRQISVNWGTWYVLNQVWLGEVFTSADSLVIPQNGDLFHRTKFVKHLPDVLERKDRKRWQEHKAQEKVEQIFFKLTSSPIFLQTIPMNSFLSKLETFSLRAF